MCETHKTLGIIIVVTFFLLGILVRTVFAGIPEPGIILYGQVLDENGSFITSGELTFTLTPVSGGESVSFSTPLSEIIGPTATYSYKLMIKCETDVPDFPGSDNMIALTSTPTDYIWTAQLEGTNVSRSAQLAISYENRGTVELEPIAVGDLENDGMEDWWELKFFSDLSRNGTLDWDGDGLSDQNEYAWGTNPLNPDTDGDGFTDGAEDRAGSDPTDPDSYPSRWLPALPLLLLDED